MLGGNFVLKALAASACCSFVSLGLFVPSPVSAQTAVRPQPDRQQWYLNAGKMTYVVGVNEQGILQSLYWGPKLSDRGLLPVAKSLPERASPVCSGSHDATGVSGIRRRDIPGDSAQG